MVSSVVPSYEQFYLILIICLHTVKWFQVLLCITNNSIKHQSFVYTQLNDQTILFHISHLFALSLNVKQFYLNCKKEPIRCYHSGSEWAWKQWKWRGTLHSPKLQHYWSLTIRLFNAMSRTFIGERVLPLCRDAVDVFYNTSRLGIVCGGQN